MKYSAAIRIVVLCLLGLSQAGRAQTLGELIEGVLSTHPAIRAQRAMGEASKQAVEAAQWQFYPTPSINYEQVGATASNDVSYPATGDKHVATLRLQQPLWTGGRLTAGLDKARAGEQASQATLESARQDLALRVAQLYADWYGAHLKREAFDTSAKAHQSLRAQIARRIAGGVSAPSDLTLLQGRARQNEADLAAAATQENAALLRIGQLLGRNVQAHTLADSLAPAPAVDGDIHNLLDQAQARSPAVLKLAAQAVAAQAEVQERKADRMPEAYLRAERQYGNFSVSGTGPQDRVFVGLSSHFGAGFSANAAEHGAQARLEAAQAEVEASRLAIGEQIQADFEQARSGQERLAALEASLDSSIAITRAWNRQFIAGRKTWLDLMNAVRELAQLEAQIADAKATLYLLRWRLAISSQGVDAAMASTPASTAADAAQREIPWNVASAELDGGEDEAPAQLQVVTELDAKRHPHLQSPHSPPTPDTQKEGAW